MYVYIHPSIHTHIHNTRAHAHTPGMYRQGPAGQLRGYIGLQAQGRTAMHRHQPPRRARRPGRQRVRKRAFWCCRATRKHGRVCHVRVCRCTRTQACACTGTKTRWCWRTTRRHIRVCHMYECIYTHTQACAYTGTKTRWCWKTTRCLTRSSPPSCSSFWPCWSRTGVWSSRMRLPRATGGGGALMLGRALTHTHTHTHTRTHTHTHTHTHRWECLQETGGEESGGTHGDVTAADWEHVRARAEPGYIVSGLFARWSRAVEGR